MESERNGDIEEPTSDDDDEEDPALAKKEATHFVERDEVRGGPCASACTRQIPCVHVV